MQDEERARAPMYQQGLLQRLSDAAQSKRKEHSCRSPSRMSSHHDPYRAGPSWTQGSSPPQASSISTAQSSALRNMPAFPDMSQTSVASPWPHMGNQWCTPGSGRRQTLTIQTGEHAQCLHWHKGNGNFFFHHWGSIGFVCSPSLLSLSQNYDFVCNFPASDLNPDLQQSPTPHRNGKGHLVTLACSPRENTDFQLSSVFSEAMSSLRRNEW